MERQRRVRIGRLTSVGRVAIELGRLYRQARYGEVETIEAYRLATILSAMAKCLETTAFEQRIAELEETLAQQRKAENFRPRIVS
jgi:hypothetical protein